MRWESRGGVAAWPLRGRCSRSCPLQRAPAASRPRRACLQHPGLDRSSAGNSSDRLARLQPARSPPPPAHSFTISTRWPLAVAVSISATTGFPEGNSWLIGVVAAINGLGETGGHVFLATDNLASAAGARSGLFTTPDLLWYGQTGIAIADENIKVNFGGRPPAGAGPPAAMHSAAEPNGRSRQRRCRFLQRWPPSLSTTSTSGGTTAVSTCRRRSPRSIFAGSVTATRSRQACVCISDPAQSRSQAGQHVLRLQNFLSTSGGWLTAVELKAAFGQITAIGLGRSLAPLRMTE